MKSFRYCILLLNVSLLLNFQVVRGQSSKKNAISFYSKLKDINVSDIKNGEHLEIAKEMPVDRFVQYFLQEGKKIPSKKYGDYLLFEKLFKDSLFTYFGRTYTCGLIDFIKVSNREMPSVGFLKLDGLELRENFVNNIIPEEDKNRVTRKERHCTSTFYSRNFKYKYIKETDEVEILCHWKIKCEFLFNIINKKYVSRYSIESKQFIY
ncbi:MAG TPA: hypothetical protein PKX92_14350 [Edaphocola sp.]|nr:hypothetical protein [Edaphocola sp.]